jgi:hypothetical protein
MLEYWEGGREGEGEPEEGLRFKIHADDYSSYDVCLA